MRRGGCTHMPDGWGKCRIRHLETPRKDHPTGIWVHASGALHAYPRRVGKMQDPTPGNPEKSHHTSIWVHASGTLHAYARRAGKSARSAPPNPAKRPPHGHMGTCERYLARISPTGGENAGSDTWKPREKSASQAYRCMRWSGCTHIPDGRFVKSDYRPSRSVIPCTQCKTQMHASIR